MTPLEIMPNHVLVGGVYVPMRQLKAVVRYCAELIAAQPAEVIYKPQRHNGLSKRKRNHLDASRQLLELLEIPAIKGE